MKRTIKALSAILLVSVAVFVAASTAGADVSPTYSSERIANGDCVFAVSTYDSIGGGNSWITGYTNVTCSHKHTLCASIYLLVWMAPASGSQIMPNKMCETGLTYGMGNDSLTTRNAYPGSMEVPGGATGTFQTQAFATVDGITYSLATGAKAITGGF